ncbi:hypothetical protein T08_7081 [Trichinella sp. T8]|nr:hypothetical protein T08_7081 [Trichinella sp. T8]
MEVSDFCMLNEQFAAVENPISESNLFLMSNRQQITDFVKKAYFAYFGIKLGDQDNSWATIHIVCHTCVEQLRKRSKKTLKSLPFGVPVVWQEPQNHVDDCYFCLSNVRGYNAKNRKYISYPNLPSATRPVPHGPDVPIPSPPGIAWTQLS